MKSKLTNVQSKILFYMKDIIYFYATNYSINNNHLLNIITENKKQTPNIKSICH